MGCDIVVSSALAFVGDVLSIAVLGGFVLFLRLPVVDVNAGMGVSGIFESAVTLFSDVSSQNWSILSCWRFNSKIKVICDLRVLFTQMVCGGHSNRGLPVCVHKVVWVG